MAVSPPSGPIRPWRASLEGELQLKLIAQSCAQMSRLIDDVLHFSRAAKDALDRSSVDVGELVSGVVERLRSREPRDVEVVVEPGLLAHADHNLLELALENLLSNAWKFTRKTPKPRIEVGSVVLDGQIVFFVRDNGVGFDPARAGRLFEPFSRLHSSSDFEGTGIGLATVKRIVERHGGRVWAEGRPNEGATIFFTLDSPCAMVRFREARSPDARVGGA